MRSEPVNRPGRYQSALGLMLFLLSSAIVVAFLLSAYHRKSEGTVPDQYHYRLDNQESQSLETLTQ